jgi:hypothetical protein
LQPVTAEKEAMSITSATDPSMLQAAQNLVNRLDINRDGKLGADEFLGLLKGLTGQPLPAAATPATATGVAISAPAATQVQRCTGDQFQFTNWQGTYTVDYVRGVDGDNPALAWQCQG